MLVLWLDTAARIQIDRQAGRPGWKDVWVNGLKDVDECGWKVGRTVGRIDRQTDR
jgi:hypothetical protein